MRIIDLKEFRLMPRGTLYMKYVPCVFEDLCAKGDTLEYDFLCESITNTIASSSSTEWSDKLLMAQHTGASLPMDFDYPGRDGCFEDGQLFAVYEAADLDGLIAKLETCKKEAYQITGVPADKLAKIIANSS